MANASCASRVKSNDAARFLREGAHQAAFLVGVFEDRRRTCGQSPGRGPCACRYAPSAEGTAHWSMLSMPPATITSTEPAASMSCANIAARMPEPHILVDGGTCRCSMATRRRARPDAPAPGRGRRAARNPSPLRRSASGFKPARCTAASIAIEPNCGAVRRCEIALKCRHRRAGHTYDHDRIRLCLAHCLSHSCLSCWMTPSTMAGTSPGWAASTAAASLSAWYAPPADTAAMQRL